MGRSVAVLLDGGTRTLTLKGFCIMKNIPFIKSEITKIQSESKFLKVHILKEEKQLSKNRKMILFLNKCILYLETNPREEFVVSMHDESERKVGIYSRRLSDWKSAAPKHILDHIKNPDKYYYDSIAPDEKNEIKKTKAQLRTLKYLLT